LSDIARPSTTAAMLW